jgi:A/G-specific adenine glycosylase
VRSTWQLDLLRWYNKNARTFPWRETSDPYAVLIAEKLLQQTAVGPAVLRAYRELVDRYPDAVALSRADVGDVEKIISSLGFRYRARELVTLGCALVERHGGRVPSTLKDLLDLPGVGDYSARAVLSFAYGKDEPIVDTNVARFLQRLLKLSGQWSNPARDRRLLETSAALVPTNQARDYNYAILDLCASLCTKKKPRCLDCPVRSSCATGSNTATSPD